MSLASQRGSVLQACHAQSVKTGPFRPLGYRIPSRSLRNNERGSQLTLLVPCVQSKLQLGSQTTAISNGADHGKQNTMQGSSSQVQAYLRQLLVDVSTVLSIQDKVQVLLEQGRVQEFQLRNPAVFECIRGLELPYQYVLLCLPAIGQGHVLQPAGEISPAALHTSLVRLAVDMARVEQFYDCLGGIIGYQLKSMELVAAGSAAQQQQQQQEAPAPVGGEAEPPNAAPELHKFHQPRGVDLAGEDGRQVGLRAASQGLAAMPMMAEIYPVGGAGDRLGLKDENTGEPLPAALLPYCGRPIMHHLIRDLQAREYLYYKLTGRQIATPVAVMTSDAKGNHGHILNLMEDAGWFGRGRNAFRLFRQPMVPVISAEDGSWLLNSPLMPTLKPGGHGAIWKLMLDNGIFNWLRVENNCVGALIRQISNPMAGTDTTLLALGGIGSTTRAAYGFMSCERTVGAAEGMQVLQERRRWRPDPRVPGGGRWVHEYGITNVEYTEFERLGISDTPVGGAGNTSAFPANTNIMYAGLEDVQRVITDAVESKRGEQLLPGLIFNLKKKVSYTDPHTGETRLVTAGRMESTMQNIADFLTDAYDTPLPLDKRPPPPNMSTFVVTNLRRKVTSSAKKRRQPGSTAIHQTPDGSFYDLQRNAWHLLQQCGLRHVPELAAKDQYLVRGPGFVVLFHPALGPLWDVIAQKLKGGAMMNGAELVLEVAEVVMKNVTVDGSLVVVAEDIMGHMEGPWGGLRSAWHEQGSNAEKRTGLTIHGLQYGREGRQMDGEWGQRSDDFQASSPRWSSSSSDSGASSSGGSSGSSSGTWVGGGSSGRGEALLRYSAQCGRISLNNVVVKNRGIDWDHSDNLYWRHKVVRHESMQVLLCGRSEFEASDVTITGDHRFVVPDGYRMVVSGGAGGKLHQRLEPLPVRHPTWEWRYTMRGDGEIRLEMVRHIRAHERRDLVGEDDIEITLDYII